MHFTNKSKDTRYSKGVRVFSVVLSIIIVCSMIFVGNIVSINASAAGTYSVTFSGVPSWAYEGTEFGVFCYNDYGEQYLYRYSSGTTVSVSNIDGKYNKIIYGRLTTDSNTASGNGRYLCEVSGTSYYFVYNYNDSPIINPKDGDNIGINVDSKLKQGSDKINVSRSQSMQAAGYELYIKAGDWGDENGEILICYQSNDNNWYVIKAGLASMNVGDNTSKYFHVKFDKQFNANQFSISRIQHDTVTTIELKENTSVSTSGFNWSEARGEFSNEFQNVWLDGSHNCISIDGLQSWSQSNYSRSASSDLAKSNETKFTVSANNYSSVEGVSIFPVEATFYDYLTDYEIENGWGSNKYLDYATSRYYQTRIPYTKFNSYISNKVSESNKVSDNWKYPLYFGNFYSDVADKEKSGSYNLDNLYYGSLSGAYVKDTRMLENNTTNYTNGTSLNNFSIWANDSSPIYSTFGSYTGSVQNLFNSTLSGTGTTYSDIRGRNLCLPNGSPALYFSDSIVDDGYARKIQTKFPFRIDNNQTTFAAYDNDYNTKNTYATNQKYTIYEFNSGYTTSGITSDNVYFNWENRAPTQINYGQGSSYEMIDANQNLGGKASNHRGFFPFDKTDDGNVAYDYGFGMRLDIPFNLSEDGCVPGVTYNNGTKVPMRFEFEGDDDVLVFIDGKLALDLGGDHGNAKGYIDFSASDPVAVVETNAVTLPKNPDTNTVLEITTKSGVASNVTHLNTSGVLTTDDGNVYDTEKEHTLTVFYMERGLCESNLHITMSFIPAANRLTTNNIVDIEGANPSLVKDIAKIAESDEFNFTYKDTVNKVDNSVSDYMYTVDVDGTVGTTRTALGSDVSINQQIRNDDAKVTEGLEGNNSLNTVIFKSQFTDEAQVTVTETPGSTNSLKYTTKYTVYDNTQSTENPVDDWNKKAVTSDTNDGRSAEFKFDTLSTATNAKNDFSVWAYNYVQYGSVKLVKDFDGSHIPTDTSAEFKVQIKLPGEESATSRAVTYTKGNSTTNQTLAANGTISLKDNEYITISGLPVGSEVEFEETTTGYTTTVGSVETKTSTAKINSTDTTTVTFKNKEIEVTVPFTAKKYIGTESEYTIPTTNDFQFTMQECSAEGNVKGQVLSNKNNDGETITFDSITYTTADAEKIYYYKIIETGSYTGYKENNDVFYVSVAISDDVKSTVTYYKDSIAAVNASETNNIVFYNEKSPTKGYLKVTKTGYGDPETDFNGTQFTYYKVSGENEKPAAGAQGTVLTVDKTKAEGKTEYDDVNSNYYASVLSGELDTGWYAVVETKAPDGYELYGEWKWVEVTAENTQAKPATVTFNNNKSTHLPTTGGIGVVVFITVGVVLIGAAILLLRPNKQAKK